MKNKTIRINLGKEDLIENSRFFLGSIFYLSIFLIIIIRLWFLQIVNGPYYLNISEKNRIHRLEVQARRGLILDRNYNIVLGNKLCFDLVYIPQHNKEEHQTFIKLSRLLKIPYSKLYKLKNKYKYQPKFLPIVLKTNLDTYEKSILETNKEFLPGIEIIEVPRRDYKNNTNVHLLGHMNDISSKTLKSYNEKNPNDQYFINDQIGQHGIEKKWEKHLKGHRGYKYIQVDALGRKVPNIPEQSPLSFPNIEAISGNNIILTIDQRLQQAAEVAFQGKVGAIVAMDPQTGEILALLSSPGYNPTMYQKGLSQEQWNNLLHNPFKPLYDKTTGGTYPPGSLFKTLLALAALEEKIVNSNNLHNCSGVLKLGRDKFHCHKRSGHGKINLDIAMQKSCDTFFYNIGLKLGIKKIAKYASLFHFGKKLGLDLNPESSGLIPTLSWKKMTTKKGWVLGDIPPIAIGQGANLLTPLQIASFYSTIANGGKIWKPFITKKIRSHLGEDIKIFTPQLITQIKNISPTNFYNLRQILENVINHGTGKRASIKGHTVAGKTATTQVINLRRYRNRKSSFSRQWNEHAMFAAFSPTEKAQIVVVVISEHDPDGGGGTVAAPIAKKIIKTYWKNKT
jgi:penicillin-binding protein 2